MLYSITKQIKEVTYTVLLLGMICTNVSTLPTDMALGNTSAISPKVQTTTPMTHPQLEMTPNLQEIYNKMEYAINMLEGGIEKYGEDSLENTIEAPETSITTTREIDSSVSIYIDDIRQKYELKFKSIVGIELSEWMTEWIENNSNPVLDIYIFFSNYIVSLEEKLVVTNTTSNYRHKNNYDLYKNPKAINIPILSAKIEEYYPFIKEDLKDILKTNNELTNRYDESYLPTDHDVAEDKIATRFLTLNKSPLLYKIYDFQSLLKYSNSNDYINKTVNLSTSETALSTLNSLKDDIDIVQKNTAKFVGGMFYQISEFLAKSPVVNITTDYIEISMRKTNLFRINLCEGNKGSSETAMVLFKKIWKFATKCFIYQLSDIIHFIKDLSSIESIHGFTELNQFLDDNKEVGYMGENIPYTEQMHMWIDEIKKDIEKIKTNNGNVKPITSMSLEIQKLSSKILELLNLVTLNFENKLEDLHEYKELTNNITLYNPQGEDIKKVYDSMKDNIKSYVNYMWRVSNYTTEYIGLTDDEKGLSSTTYITLLHGRLLALNPAYYRTPFSSIKDQAVSSMNSASQFAASILLTVSAASTYVLQRIFFFR
ncbi:hypothetical protein NEIRO02_0634 [Nematocida sp. AWRm79]|nr:hypothetical protein NEIRO02_0634 [Nematocida sp. AWRm79]